MSELELIRWIRGQSAPIPGVSIGPGDDCAELAPSGDRPILITTDALAEGRHFPIGCDPEKVGYKTMAVSLSDIAAMGGRPIAAVATVTFPEDLEEGADRAIYRGMRRALDPHDVPVVGGDITSWSGGLVLGSTLIGLSPAGGAVRRSGALTGDLLWVTGELGGSLLGRHLDFEPRVREGRMLAEDFGAGAMIDVSDGLATDALHLAEESGCGVELEASSIPISEAAARRAAGTGRTPLDHALSDGEDFELLVALSPEASVRLAREWKSNVPIRNIGRFVTGGSRIHMPGGEWQELVARGFEHRWGRRGRT